MSVRTADVIEVLTKSADYIDQHGWTQGASQTPDGRVCSKGAISLVIFDDPFPCGDDGDSQQWDLYDATLDALAVSVDYDYDVVGRSNAEDAVIFYNDGDYDRTQQDITRWFRQTADGLKATVTP